MKMDTVLLGRTRRKGSIRVPLTYFDRNPSEIDPRYKAMYSQVMKLIESGQRQVTSNEID